MMEARLKAAAALAQVLERGRPVEEVLDGLPGLAALAPRDRGFVRLLVATTLRRLGQIDALIGRCLDQPLRDKAVEGVLRLGVCQLLFLDTPPHAAVATSVDLVAASGKTRSRRMKGLVNAVLRRLSVEGRAWAEAQDAPRCNCPDWLWDSWTAAYGADAARRIAEAHLTEAPLDLTVKSDPETWAERLGAVVLPTGTLRRPAGGLITDLPGFAEGAWWVQDAAAALPARLLGPVAGRRVADLCAAPGGKTAQLAAAGAEVIAVDRSGPRMARLKSNLQRLDLGAAWVIADAASWQPAAPLDAVLLDAPCSSTGTIRRHPDVARHKQPQDVAKLIPLQDALLANAVSLLPPGGLLVYSVCSLQPEEGPARIAALLAAGAPVARVPLAAGEVGGLAELITSEGDLRALPCHLAALGGLDGFYAARLRRITRG